MCVIGDNGINQKSKKSNWCYIIVFWEQWHSWVTWARENEEAETLACMAVKVKPPLGRLSNSHCDKGAPTALRSAPAHYKHLISHPPCVITKPRGRRTTVGDRGELKNIVCPWLKVSVMNGWQLHNSVHGPLSKCSFQQPLTCKVKVQTCKLLQRSIVFYCLLLHNCSKVNCSCENEIVLSLNSSSFNYMQSFLRGTGFVMLVSHRPFSGQVST